MEFVRWKVVCIIDSVLNGGWCSALMWYWKHLGLRLLLSPPLLIPPTAALPSGCEWKEAFFSSYIRPISGLSRCFINVSSLLNLYCPFLAMHVHQPHRHKHEQAASSSHLTLTRSCQILTYHKWWAGCRREELEFVVLGLCQCSRSWI